MPTIPQVNKTAGKWVTFRIDSDLQRKVKIAAVEDQISLQAICIKFIVDGLKQRERKRAAA